jgi:hypothetical protein
VFRKRPARVKDIVTSPYYYSATSNTRRCPCPSCHTTTPSALRASLHELEPARALHRVGALQQGSLAHRRIPSVSLSTYHQHQHPYAPKADHMSLSIGGTRAMSESTMCSAPSCASSATRKSSSSCRSYVTCSSRSTTSPWPWRIHNRLV